MSRKRSASVIAAALACLTGGVAHSAPGKGPTAAEFAELKQKVDQQAELLLRLTQLEAEHYEMLIKWMQGTARPGKGAPPPLVQPKAGDTDGGEIVETERKTVAQPKLATITGRVDVKGKPWGPIYVYVDN